MIPLYALFYFFVLRWLADPYKKDKKSAPQKAPVQFVATMPVTQSTVQPAPPTPPTFFTQPAAPVKPETVENKPVRKEESIIEKNEKIEIPAKPVNVEPTPVIPPTVSVQQNSAADELKKYKDLLDQGALTQEEFDTVKKRILNL